MLKVTNVLCFVLIHYIYFTNSEYLEDDDRGEPLLLTPFIKENRLEEARDAARVVLEGAENISSYSGYITVDEEQESNIFFWFFESMDKVSSDPVLLWLQGELSASCLNSIFLDHGPFQVSRGNKLILREHTWVKNHSIIYVDTPVGIGGSFTKGAYSNTTNGIVAHLHTVLLQFFKLFPEFQKNQFFMAGQRYAGKYIPELARIISERNAIDPVRINLKGMAINNPISDPINQIAITDYLYELGSIDAAQRSKIQPLEQRMINDMATGDDSEFLSGLSSIFGVIEMFTSRQPEFNILFDNNNLPDDIESYLIFINNPNITRALHYTNAASNGMKAVLSLEDDYAKSVASTIDLLLKKYRIMFYTGQLNIFPNVDSVNTFIQKLNYYNNTKNYNSLIIDGHFVGPYTVVGNLLNLVVRGAGRQMTYEKPEWALKIITKFTRNQF